MAGTQSQSPNLMGYGLGFPTSSLGTTVSRGVHPPACVPWPSKNLPVVWTKVAGAPWWIVPRSLSGSLAAGGQEDDTNVGSMLSVPPPLSPAQQQLNSWPGGYCGAFPDTAARALHLRLHRRAPWRQRGHPCPLHRVLCGPGPPPWGRSWPLIPASLEGQTGRCPQRNRYTDCSRDRYTEPPKVRATETPPEGQTHGHTPEGLTPRHHKETDSTPASNE